MSIGYLEHSKTRYLRNHYEIYDYRKEKEAQALEQAAARQKREEALEARQQERRDALDALIESNRAYTPSNRLEREIEEESRQRRLEKERERERRLKAAEDRSSVDKFKGYQSRRSTFNDHLITTREDRTSRLEKEAQLKQIERDRRSKEREARSYARSGLKADGSDDESADLPKASASASSRYARATPSSNRLMSKYRDSGASSSSYSERRAARSQPSSSEPASSSSAPVEASEE